MEMSAQSAAKASFRLSLCPEPSQKNGHHLPRVLAKGIFPVADTPVVNQSPFTKRVSLDDFLSDLFDDKYSELIPTLQPEQDSFEKLMYLNRRASSISSPNSFARLNVPVPSFFSLPNATITPLENQPPSRFLKNAFSPSWKWRGFCSAICRSGNPHAVFCRLLRHAICRMSFTWKAAEISI